ncbi:uncharacterized protein V1516DRAFT_664449 [Lipomyces oligophaga]|uniref:uncharacterized protein n=1 Tax=Lipomyces oligophaga TaxID=45792 RepID=UPI0034CF6060
MAEVAVSAVGIALLALAAICYIFKFRKGSRNVPAFDRSQINSGDTLQRPQPARFRNQGGTYEDYVARSNAMDAMDGSVTYYLNGDRATQSYLPCYEQRSLAPAYNISEEENPPRLPTYDESTSTAIGTEQTLSANSIASSVVTYPPRAVTTA